MKESNAHGAEHEAKPTHKKSNSERTFSRGFFERLARSRFNLEPNVLTGEPINDQQGGVLYKRVPDNQTYEDTVTVGGVHYLPRYAIRGEEWRFREDKRPGSADVLPLGNTPEKKNARLKEQEVGKELELMLTTDSFHVSTSVEKHIEQLGGGIAEEFIGSTTEINFPHSNNTHELARRNLRILKIFNEDAKRQNDKVFPGSMLPDWIRPEDVNNDPYIKGMLKMGGWENLQLYGGSHSLQIMCENVELRKGREAVNMLYQVTPLLKALSLTSPFGFGEIHPNMKKVLERQQERGALIQMDEEMLKAVDYDRPLSLRQVARTAGSRLGGGVIREPFPESPEEFYRAAEIILIEGKSPTPDRVGGKHVAGHHNDIRYRRTIGLKGANEISNLDTFAGDPKKITAIQAASRSLNWLLQVVPREEISMQLPELFKPNPDAEDFKRMSLNSLAIDNEGVNAQVLGADGQEYRAGELLDKLIDFIAKPATFVCQPADSGEPRKKAINYPGLPDGIIAELKKSMHVPTDADFIQAPGTRVVDGKIIPSMAGFYETGLGAPSHWQRARGERLTQVWGGDEAEVKRAVLRDYVKDGEDAWANHIQKLTERDIDKLFQA